MSTRTLLLLFVLGVGQFSAQSQSFTSTGSMATSRRFAQAVLLHDGRVFTAGGEPYPGLSTDIAEIFNPATGLWTPTQTRTLEQFAQLTATVMTDGRVLLAGGGATDSRDSEIYDPVSDAFTPAGQMSFGRGDFQSVLLNDGRVMVIGGYRTGLPTDHTLVEVFSPTAGTWSILGQYPGTADFGISLTPLSDGSILAAGGIPKGGYTGGSEVFRFLPATNTWVTMTPLVNQWWNNYKAVPVSGNRIMFLGQGGSLQNGNTPELYSPFSGSSGAAALTTRVDTPFGSTAAPLSNGNVLLTGGLFSCFNNSGWCGDVSVNTATVFDSSAETWTSVGPMTDPRAYHTATLLQNGQVLVAGGQGFYYAVTFISYSGLSSAELFGTPNSAGMINVTTNLPTATFTITGPATYNGSGTSFTTSNAPSGTYTITFGVVTGYITPSSQTLSLSVGAPINFNCSYVSSASLGPGNITRSGSFAEPVNTATGNYYTTHTDIQVPGKGLAFAFTRYYNGLDTYNGPMGIAWTHSFNISLRLVSGQAVVKEADGHEDVFSPTGSGNYAPQTPGLFDSLHMNGDGSFTLTRKNQTRLNFSSSGQLLTLIDRNGNTQTLAYSGTNLSSITDTSGRIFTLSYDGSNRVVVLTDPLGRSIHYSYDGSGNLASVQDALGGITQYSYDIGHRMTTGVDPRLNSYLQNTYDLQGRVVLQKNARGFATTFAYDTPTSGSTTITDPVGNVTRHVHDGSLRLVQIIDALGGTTSFTYSANNLKLSTTDPLGRTQAFGYDGNDNLTSATDPNGKTTLFAYSTNNDLLQVTDRLGRVSHFSYDSKGNLLSAVDTAGNTSRFTYSPAGQVVSARNARNFTTGFTYDAAGNLTKVTDALGGTVQLTYDAVGRLLSVKNQLGNTSTRSYDANSRLVSVTDPLANMTQFVYDANGNLTKLTDANGKITSYSFDATNQLMQVTDAIGGITNYAYDGNTDLVSVTDAKSHVTAYAYDDLRRLRTTTDPLGHQKQYTYDGDGNVTSALDGNGKTNTFNYDSLNRLALMALSDGKSVSYAYDAVGNRLNMVDWRGTTQYFSDVLNRVTSVTTPDGKTISYAYDAVGNRVSLTYPTGKKVESQFDALNRLAQVTDLGGNVTTYGHDAAGNLTTMNQPNRTSSMYFYDAANRLLKVVNSSKNQILSSFSYTLDKVGNRLRIISSTGAATSYGYDGLYRLTSWTTPSAQITGYAYDAVGNRTAVTGPGGNISYTYDSADQLLTANSITFAYDGNGSLIQKTIGGTNTNYMWDALNRLIGVTGGSINTHYDYDGDGNRVQQQVSAGTYQYLNDVVTSLPVVLNETGPDGIIDYAHGFSLISESIQQKQNFYQFDGMGSVTTVTNEAGAQQANYGYDPWGQAGTPNDPPITLDALGTKNKYKFTGEASDPGDGLLFLRARYYDPSLTRFLSKDPLDIDATYPFITSAFVYVDDNPLNLKDPLGYTAEPNTTPQTPPNLIGGKYRSPGYFARINNQIHPTLVPEPVDSNVPEKLSGALNAVCNPLPPVGPGGTATITNAAAGAAFGIAKGTTGAASAAASSAGYVALGYGAFCTGFGLGNAIGSAIGLGH